MNTDSKTNTNTMKVAGSITTSIGSQGGSNDGDNAGSHVTSIGSQGGRNDGDNAGSVVEAMWHLLCLISCLVFWMLFIDFLNPATKSLPVLCLPFGLGVFTYSSVLKVKRRMARRIQITKTVCILKTMVSYFMTCLGAYCIKEYRLPSDFFPVLVKSGLPISFGVLVESSLGLTFHRDDFDLLQVVASVLRVFGVILITIERVEAFYVTLLFFIMCGAYCCSKHIVNLASLFATHIGSVEDLACSIMSSIDMLYGRQVPTQVSKKSADLHD